MGQGECDLKLQLLYIYKKFFKKTENKNFFEKKPPPFQLKSLLFIYFILFLSLKSRKKTKNIKNFESF